MPQEIEQNERMLHVGDFFVRYMERGNGPPIVAFPAGSDSAAGIIDKLAECHRVIRLDASSAAEVSADKLAEKIPAALTGIGIDNFSVIGVQSGAGAALALAVAAPQHVEKLILISPQIPASELPDLTTVTAPTLVVVGTSGGDRPIEVGRLCREKINSCHLSFVYGASNPPVDDRIEACLQAIIRFLEEGEQFIIMRESQVMRP